MRKCCWLAYFVTARIEQELPTAREEFQPIKSGTLKMGQISNQMTNELDQLTEEFIKCGIDPKETALAETYRQLNSEQIKEDGKN